MNKLQLAIIVVIALTIVAIIPTIYILGALVLVVFPSVFACGAYTIIKNGREQDEWTKLMESNYARDNARNYSLNRKEA